MSEEIRVVGDIDHRGLRVRVINDGEGKYLASVYIPDGADGWCDAYKRNFTDAAMSRREVGWLNGFPGAHIGFGNQGDTYLFNAWFEGDDGKRPESDDDAMNKARLVADYCKVHIDELNKGHIPEVSA